MRVCVNKRLKGKLKVSTRCDGTSPKSFSVLASLRDPAWVLCTFFLYWPFSLFWCPAQSLYSPGLAPELPPGPPPGPDWILLLQKALIYESGAPSLRHTAVCRQEREVVHHAVCVLWGRVTP